ncbi:MAG: hypothetical protein AB7H66_17180 [Hyphomonadaceae bacterium]
MRSLERARTTARSSGMDAPYLIDARRLIDEFAETDAILPPLVFALLSLYLRDGPFEFDASALAEKLTSVNPAVRVNAERLAALQPELERFFELDGAAWRPRTGVLTYERDERGGEHIGEVPGESAHPPH